MRILGADSFVGKPTSISSIPVNALMNHDICIVRIENGDDSYIPAIYFLEYVFNDGNPENIPYIVVPLDNTIGFGDDDGGRWKLKNIFVYQINAVNIITNRIISEIPGIPILIGDTFTVTSNGITVDGQVVINSEPTEPPLVVNSSVMVENLNAEFISGQNIDNFIRNYNFDVAIDNGVTELDVYFPHSVVAPPHYTVLVDICNTVDPDPSIYSYIITRKEQTYFTIRFSGIIDSANYTLHYLVIGEIVSPYVPPTVPESGSAGMLWFNVSSNTDAVSGRGYFVDTSSNLVNITLPSNTEVTVGDRIEIVDHYKTFSTNNCIIQRNGHLIMGLPENFICDVDNTSIVMIYSGLTFGWSIVGYTTE
jgi:hypothetical protein